MILLRIRSYFNNFQDLKVRFFSSVVLLLIVVLAFLLGLEAWLFLLCVASSIMIFEWLQIVAGNELKIVSAADSAVSSLVFAAAMYSFFVGRGDLGFLIIIGFVPLISLFLLVYGLNLRSVLWAMAGKVFIASSCASFFWILMDSYQDGFLAWLICVIAVSSDVGAYFSGRLLKGPLLAPKISPGKTWSGFLGGCFFSVLLGSIFVSYFLPNKASSIDTLQSIMIFLVFSLISQTGDLLESLVKRRFYVKDSGSLMPGHGGILDRFDGLMTLSLAVAIFLTVSTLFFGSHELIFPLT